MFKQYINYDIEYYAYMEHKLVKIYIIKTQKRGKRVTKFKLCEQIYNNSDKFEKIVPII